MFVKYLNSIYPIEYDSDYKFVGEYVYFDESRSIRHIDELKKSL